MTDLRREPKPGDVIAFEGRGVVPGVIKLATRSPYSHVAIVGRPQYVHLAKSDATDRDNCRALAGRILMFESTSLNPLTCRIHQRRVDGVQAHYWRESVSNYKGKAWLLKLKDPLSVGESVRLSHYLCSQLHRHYDYLGAAKSGTRLLKHFLLPSKHLEYLFCSEMVAEALQHCRHFDKNLNTSKITPGGLVKYGLNYSIFREPVRL